MIDRIGRRIDYLRVSVTDRCNLRCRYCAPPGSLVQAFPDVLTADEIAKVVGVGRDRGVVHVRLTGGEPLVRPDILSIVSRVKSLGIPDLSMTTNGMYLTELAGPLKRAGLDRVNVSLDSLSPEVFREVTGNGDVNKVLAGIRAALEAGLNPVKVNVVVMAGVNETEVEDLARLSLDMPVSVRFIEVMPIGPDAETNGASAVPVESIRSRLGTLGTLEPANEGAGAGPAQVYRLPGAPGTVGFIAALSEPFCASCNRLRLTADGKLRPCLASDVEVDLLPALRGGNTERDLASAFAEALHLKPRGHELSLRHPSSRRMCQIGG